MNDILKTALATVSGAIVATAVFLGADVADVVDEESPSPAVPAAEADCPPGWRSDTVGDLEARHVQASCQQGPWIVYLTNDGKFWKALGPEGGEFIEDTALVPGWQ